MKKMITLMCALFIAGNLYAQSNFDSLFILDNNISEAQAIAKLETRNNVSDIARFSTSQINFVHNQNLFIEDENNLTLLVFDEGKLTQQDVRIWFNPGSGQTCISKYKQLVEGFLGNKSYKVAKINIADPKTNETTGEQVDITKVGNTHWKASIFYFIEFDDNKVRDYYCPVKNAHMIKMYA